jgi:hypothetical protein
MSIALLSTYAPSEGFGGPARIFHQRRVLETAGHTVIHVVVESNPSRQRSRPQDLVHLVERPFRAPVDHIYDDVDLGRRAAKDKNVVRSIIDHLAAQDVSLVILEQPFLVDVAEQLAKALSVSVVYSCQNIEHRLRRDLERFQPDWRRPLDRADEVRTLEQRAVDLADAVTAICPSDQHGLRQEFGCESTLVPNGTSMVDSLGAAAPPSPQQPPLDFVFTGSSYWPNVEGFAQVATPSLAFLPPDSRIHVAGSVGQHLLTHPQVARCFSINRSRLELHGFVSMPELMRMVTHARCVLVPVFVGEGSNLKSADALGSGRPVIMSRRATHGYEDVLAVDSTGVTVVDTPREFRTAMIETLRQVDDPPSTSGRSAVLSWNRRLIPLIGVVERSSERR